MDATVVMFDLETTGLDTDEAEILQLAALAATEEQEEFSMFTLPNVPIEAGASAVHGITRSGDQLVREGRVLPSTSLERGIQVKLWYKSTGCPLILDTPQNCLSMKYSIHLKYSKTISIENLWHLE